MGDHFPLTCLSPDKHDDNILDVTLHYFGCLRLSERRQYFSGLPEKSKRRIRGERIRITRLRSSLEAHPETDTGAILKQFRDSLDDWRGRKRTADPYAGKSWPLADGPDDSVDADIKASMIFFKDSRPYDIPGVDNKFPNQKISIKKLLAEEKETNPLMKPCEDNMIRYFHLPANNMIWVEEAIARYYHEKRPESYGILKSKLQPKTKTQMLLRPEFWQGQQHRGVSSEVHARHMRPFCDVISIDPVSSERLPKNLVLFMPYLHWETDRGRTRTADVIKEVNKDKFSSMVEVVDRVTANEQGTRTGGNTAGDDLKTPTTLKSKKPISTRHAISATTTHRRMILGRILLLGAALAEAMDFCVEKKLIFEYLHKRPPLHPRRTLDQSYYGALKNTQTRDRDQVVYRATTPVPHDCPRKDQKRKACRQCNEDIRMVPRLIMVDQLWLWILDEKTVITSFPRRWGRNRPDPSAVHKSLRMRLKTAREDEIRSAFDLAIIIIDQCSRVFFDRTKTTDQQPNLVEIFADAISGVTYKQTAAFDQFLIYTHLASKEYNSKDKSGTTATQNTLLNVNPEGNLLKEIKDILDELHIITRIKIQQQNIAESFVKHVKHTLLPKVASAEALKMAMPSEASLLKPGNVGSLQREQLEAAKWTLARADHLLEDIQDRISELNTLEDSAKKASIALKDLLTLKQQQAGVVEAREAVKQATETFKQGRSIMLFTVVTIVFLPLSFCAAIFGMNTAEFNSGLLTLRQEFIYMFPISIAIVCTSFILAFNSSSFLSALGFLIWAFLSFPVKVATAWVVTKTGLYTLSRDLAAKGNALKDREQKMTATMKANAMREKIDLKEMKEIWKEDEPQEDKLDDASSSVERAQSSNRSQTFLHAGEAV